MHTGFITDDVMTNSFYQALEWAPECERVHKKWTKAFKPHEEAPAAVQRRYLYLLQHVLELHQELLGVFSFVRDAIQGLGELTLQKHTERDKLGENN